MPLTWLHVSRLLFLSAHCAPTRLPSQFYFLFTSTTVWIVMISTEPKFDLVKSEKTSEGAAVEASLFFFPFSVCFLN